MPQITFLLAGLEHWPTQEAEGYLIVGESCRAEELASSRERLHTWSIQTCRLAAPPRSVRCEDTSRPREGIESLPLVCGFTWARGRAGRGRWRMSLDNADSTLSDEAINDLCLYEACPVPSQAEIMEFVRFRVSLS